MKIHCIGIGGIGVSSLAQYYLQKGHAVSGSDLASSPVTEDLAKQGIAIVIGQDAKHIARDLDMVVYSPAVKPDNPEYRQAKTFGIVLKSYPEALGELTKEYTTIAISGAHGKSTTTSMVGLLLTEAGLDPTVIVGTRLREFGNRNFRMGKSKYLVIEACEYDGSFLNYHPDVIVITNIDKEHMDYFKTFARVLSTFKSFIMRLPAGGLLIANKDDRYLKKIITKSMHIAYFGMRQKEAVVLKKILQIPGKHNISNALDALTVARELGISDEISYRSLGRYQGSWRRFEIFQKQSGSKKYTLISDYGHHPTEVMATLQAAREKYPKQNLWCIFQPHQHQRTFYLLKDFIALFKKVPIDHIIISDIYDVAGRETKTINHKISSPILVKKIAKKHVQYMPMAGAEQFVKEHIKDEDVLIVMGAGDIYKLVDKF